MSITMVFRRLAFAALMMLGSAASAAFAQTPDLDDPPGRVGRLSYMEGTVSSRNTDEDQWVPATLNLPVTTGDSFWTEPNGRAEIQIGSADLRLDQLTAIQVVQLDDAATQIAIDQGAINVRLRDMPPGGVRLITPRGSVALIQPGRYHIDVAPPQDDRPGDHVRVAVLDGAARIDGLAAPLTVTTGHSATLREGEAYPLLAQAIALPLDSWALERERALNPQETARYVSPEMTGSQDLGRYGQWGTDPSYGAVWYPSATVVDWAPYRYGHWAYIRPWGWTWIDDQPWGFAPFHYGRWVRIHDRWGWCPGRRVVRPIYAPALVAFVGGGNFSVAVFSGRRAPAIGWVPLGPHELYRPQYRHSTTYVRNVNITHVDVTVINAAADRRERDSVRGFHNRDGMTVVSSAAFTGAAPVAKVRMPVRADDIGDAKIANSLDQLRPSRAAKAGLLVPAAAASNRNTAVRNADRQRSRHGDRDDAHLTAPTQARPTVATAEPAGDPNVLPRAPGPNRVRPATDGRDGKGSNDRKVGNVPPSERRNREPAGSPLSRPDRVEPTLSRPGTPPAIRTPNSATAAPSGARAPNDLGQRVMPPGRPSGAVIGRPGEPPGRQPNPAAGRGRDEPRIAPRPVAPAQTPGRAPNTVAPTRPAPVQIAPSPAPQSSLDRSRPAVAPAVRPSEPPRDAQRGSPPNRRPDGSDRRRDEPRLNIPGGGAGMVAPRQETPVVRMPAPVQQAAPSRQIPARETVERRSPQPTVQRIQPQREIRREAIPAARPETRREARPQPQPSTPRDVAPRRIEQPARAQPQEAQQPGNGRRKPDDSKRSGG